MFLTILALPACGVIDTSLGGKNHDISASAKPLKYNDKIMNSKLAPPKGLSHKKLFNENLGTDDRFDRLETVVQDLNDTLNGHLPSIENLTAIEKEIEQLVGQLKTLVANPAPTATPANIAPLPSPAQDKAETSKPQASAAPTPIKPAPAPTAAAPKSDTGAPMIKNIRISQDPQKTRIVFDSNKKINYNVEYDSAENLVLVTAANSSSAASVNGLARKSSKVKSIDVQDSNGSQTFVISLNAPATVGKGTLLTPNKDSTSYRYFFDIK